MTIERAVTTDNEIPLISVILIALIQGLSLLFLHQVIELEFWFYQDPQWLFSFYGLAVVAPTILLLSLNTKSPGVTYRWTACFSIFVFAIGYYTGSQAIPVDRIIYTPLVFPFGLALLVASFKGLMYIQHFAIGEPLTYSKLFLLSWRNFLTLALSLLFTLCFYGVLMLWAGLFKAIKIDFFYDLFIERWFFYPVLALANGFGVIIFRQQSTVIDTITRIQQALMKFLLVILVFVSIIFLITLLFTGLLPLWETGGSKLILGMQALTLFFLNAVYQDDPKKNPYPLWLHRFIYIGIALLPIYSAISFYGLSLRVDQYGWSLSRCWGFLLWAVFALFALGYLWGIVRLKDQWLHQLSWVNVRMGLVVLVTMFVVNSPVLDFRKIAVNSQLARLNNGEVSIEDFDYAYFRYNLARPGYIALEGLKRNISKSNPEILVLINSLYANLGGNDFGSSEELLLSAIKRIDAEIPSDLGSEIYSFLSESPWRIKNNQGYYLFSVNLNENSDMEYVLLEERSNRHQLTLFYWSDKQWKHSTMSLREGLSWNGTDIIAAIKNKSFAPRKAQWKDIEIGELLFSVQ